LNGLQARTKPKLSADTIDFAEQCYEQRLFFYVCEALLVCAENEQGRTKAHKIIVEGREGRNLKDIWSPLFEFCAGTLRTAKLESSSIR
ncbi:hypothetical protein PFISCL1PPCAC_4796, partial [Pristionchus fissidentatus]